MNLLYAEPIVMEDGHDAIALGQIARAIDWRPGWDEYQRTSTALRQILGFCLSICGSNLYLVLLLELKKLRAHYKLCTLIIKTL